MASAEKISKVDAQGDNDVNIQEIIEKIDEVQNQVDVLNEKASEEILKVEQKYNEIRQPYYEKRSNLIKQIPHFWAVSFMNHPQFSAVITDEDEKILEYLESLIVKESEDIKSGYKIIFTFASNPYFKNSALIKQFNVNENGEASESTKIDWYPGKDVTAKTVSKEKKRSSEAMQESFFNFFDDSVSGYVDDFGEVIKDDLWNNPMQYYLASELDDEEGENEEDLYDEEDEDIEEANEESVD